jgi:CRISPR-associated protein Cas1
MRIKDLHILPKFRDGWSHLYVEHCRVDREEKAVAIHDAEGTVRVPCANLALLMLGPGVSITHAAVLTLADSGCLVAWCGEGAVRFYAAGLGESRSAAGLLQQVEAYADPKRRLDVVRRMYLHRFSEKLEETLTLQQIRGKEGIRVRETYQRFSRETGVAWSGRSYSRGDWSAADPVNRALSAANSCLYGICHAAILSCGYSPAIGFVHTGKMLSFVYDVADLYKTETSIPAAFKATAEGEAELERRVRHQMRDLFFETNLLGRIVPDIQSLIGEVPKGELERHMSDPSLPGELWDGQSGTVTGGRNHGEEERDGDHHSA